MKGAARRLLLRARDVGEAPVPSPCICVCTIDPHTGWCQGCFRTIDEVAAWSALPDEDRLAVWDRLRQRAHGVLAERQEQP